MRRNLVSFVILTIFLIFLGADLFSQTQDWKTENSKDGTMTVKYKVSKRFDEKGESVPLIEYVTTSTEKVSMEKCFSIIKNISMHKIFQGDDISENTKTISDNEWILYYMTKGFGPFPDSDSVSRMTFSEDVTQKTGVFSIIAEPTESENKKIKRITYYNMSYAFEDLGNGTTAITITASMSPAFSVPVWMINSSFPSAAFDVMKKFVELAK